MSRNVGNGESGDSDEMIRVNKLIQLEGPQKVGEFGESGDSVEISPRLLTK